MRRLLVANRGEIARRVHRAGRGMGYEVAVVSTPEDRDAPVRREADAVLEVDAFLDIPGIVRAASAWGAHLLHPGYGYLSESPLFAQAVEEAGIRFVGPSPGNLRDLGAKEPAKALARACGIPVLDALPSADLKALPPERWVEALAERGIRPPFLVKASGGGGGRGMRVVADPAGLPDAVHRASREAQAAFGDGTVFVEPYLRSPRHVEAQVFGDGKGGAVFLGERECSLQRRHQKVMEEAPSPALDPGRREALGRAAVALAERAAYRGAGTVEFLLDPEGAFHFLEVNARLQVEHPVTELAYGLDLVRAQLELAEGRWPAALVEPGAFRMPVPRGVAMEARVLAEDPRHGFRPTPGHLSLYQEPDLPGVRVDSGVVQGGRVGDHFDSLLAKVVVSGADRAGAAERLSRALEAFPILGCTTNLPLLQAITRSEDFLLGRFSTGWIQENLAALNAPLLPAPWMAFLGSAPFREALALALRGQEGPASPAAGRFLAQGSTRELALGPAAFRVERTPAPGRLRLAGPVLRDLLAASAGAPSRERGPGLQAALAALPEALTFPACRLDGATLGMAIFGETLALEDPLADLARTRPRAQDPGEVEAPMAGTILEVLAAAGDWVERDQVLFVLESMKMQFEVPAPRPGRVARVLVRKGDVLPGPALLAVLD
jgi:acetyl/propionyl-CoA carboxylase alpha subunit